MIVDELVTLLKFDVNGMGNAEAFNELLEKIEDKAKDVVVAITGVVASVGFFADRVSKAVAENYEWAKSNGVVAESYQRFEHAANIVGGSLDDIRGDLVSWVRTAKASGQSLEEIFLQEAKSIEGMTAEQSRAFLMARGYSDTAIRMIQKGEGELSRFFAQAQVIPEENLKASVEYAETWREISSEIRLLMTSAVASALPALKNVLSTIREFVQRNREMVKSAVGAFFKSVAITLKGLFIVLAPVVRAIELLLKTFDILTLGVGKYIVIVGGLTAAFIALGIAATINAAKGIASLMGKLSSYIDLIGTVIGRTRSQIGLMNYEIIVQKIKNGVLLQEIKEWWMLLQVRWRFLIVNLRQVALTIKSIIVNRIHNLTIKQMQLGYIGLVKSIWMAIVAGGKFALTLVVQTIPALIKTAVSAAWFAVVFLTKLTVALIAGTVQVTIFNAALWACPITWIIAGIVALGAVIYLMIKYWDVVTDYVQRFFKWLFTGTSSASKWLRTFLTIALWPIMIPLRLIIKYWKEIKAGFVWLGSVGKNIWRSLSDAVNNFLKPIKAAWGYIRDIAGWIKDLFTRSGRFANVGAASNPPNTIPASFAGVATASPSQITNNSQRSSSYVDQRNITINTNASSGPALAAYMRRTNNMTASGIGMAGAF